MAEWCIGVDSPATRFAEPVPFRDDVDAIAALVHCYIASIAEDDVVIVGEVFAEADNALVIFVLVQGR